MNLLFASALFFLATPAETPTAKEPALPKKPEIQALSHMQEQSRSVMIIDPKQRADDYVKAFAMLSQEKSATKVYFELAGGEKITNVIDLKVMPSSTVIVFRYNTPQGIKFQVVDIEDIIGIHHL